MASQKTILRKPKIVARDTKHLWELLKSDWQKYDATVQHEDDEIDFMEFIETGQQYGWLIEHSNSSESGFKFTKINY